MTATESLPSRSIGNWLVAMRLPFTTVALVPFAVGVFLAHSAGRPIFALGALLGGLAVFSICVGCYLLGEVCDQEEDRYTIEFGRSKFAGGTLQVVKGVLSARAVGWAAGLCFALATAVGVTVAVLQASPLLFGLGALGGLAAVSYSLPPLRLVSRGLGELLIAVCYGWLPLVTGYASATGALPSHSYLFSLPVALSIFNVILVNEFPDYEADRAAQKRNLLYRIGKPAGAQVYATASFLSIVALFAIWWFFRRGSLIHLAAIVPASALALWLGVQVALRSRWRDRAALEPVCGLTIVLNHLCSLTVGALVTWP